MTDFKIILYGEYGIGKTCLTTRLLRNTFNEHSQSTIGASFASWKTEFVRPDTKPSLVSFGIWDTAGQERFSSLLPMYLRDADAVFYCWNYNVAFDEETADSMYNKAKEYSPDCHFYLVMTKIDETPYPPRSQVAEVWARLKQLEGFFYTSSLTGEGVQELFTTMAKKLVAQPTPVKFDEFDIKVEKRGFGSCC